MSCPILLYPSIHSLLTYLHLELHVRQLRVGLRVVLVQHVLVSSSGLQRGGQLPRSGLLFTESFLEVHDVGHAQTHLVCCGVKARCQTTGRCSG